MTKAHTLATKVHSYRSANDPAALKAAIQEVFAEVGRTSDGQSAESAFEELAGFPEGLAMATISAFASSGNHPIGKEPGSDAVQSPAANQTAGAQPQAKSAAKSGSNWNVMIIVVVGIVIFALRSKKGRRR